MKNESAQNKDELKVPDSETYRLKTEERTKNDEEWRRTSTKALWKHLGLYFFHLSLLLTNFKYTPFQVA